MKNTPQALLYKLTGQSDVETFQFSMFSTLQEVFWLQLQKHHELHGCVSKWDIPHKEPLKRDNGGNWLDFESPYFQTNPHHVVFLIGEAECFFLMEGCVFWFCVMGICPKNWQNCTVTPWPKPPAPQCYIGLKVTIPICQTNISGWFKEFSSAYWLIETTSHDTEKTQGTLW